MKVMIKLNRHAETSALIYAEAVTDACTKKGKRPSVPVLSALTDTDDYSHLRKISEVEYAIGWLNGCAETCGVTIEVLWEHLSKILLPKNRLTKSRVYRACGPRPSGASSG